MKKYLMLFVIFFAMNHGYSVPVTESAVVLKGENLIDFQVYGDTVIISNLAAPFVPTGIAFYGTNIVDALDYATTPIFTVGWNSPYADLISFGFSPLSVTGNFYSTDIGDLPETAYGRAPVIPAGTDIYLSVLAPDTFSTANIQQVYIMGYYVY